jgi:predicted ribosomally synthesized peptide with nif11-like leader
MSVDNVKNFYGKMESDAALVQKVQESNQGRNGNGDGDGLDALVAVASENGYYFTKDEALQFLSTQAGADAGAAEAKLSDEQLESVAGGFFSFNGTCNTAICTITNRPSKANCDPSKSGLDLTS